jgi:hypothetical protein
MKQKLIHCCLSVAAAIDDEKILDKVVTFTSFASAAVPFAGASEALHGLRFCGWPVGEDYH